MTSKLHNLSLADRFAILKQEIDALTKLGGQVLAAGYMVYNDVQLYYLYLPGNGMLTLEANGFPVVLDVHDEILCEVPECRADLKAFTQIMEQSPDWVKQYRVPLKSDPWLGARYRK